VALRGAIRSAIGSEAGSAYGTARWDDAVRHLYGELDAGWATANVSGTDITYIIDDRGELLFAKRASGVTDPPLRQVAPKALAALLARLPRTRASALARRNGVGMLGLYRDRPALFGAMPIVPLRGQARLPSESLRFLVYVDVIDQTFLSRWSQDYGLRGLRFGRARNADWMQTELREANGASIGYLSWIPARPGLQALKDILPYLVPLAAFLLLLAGALTTILRRQTRILVRVNEEQRLLALEADTLRVQAEASLAEAKTARDSAERAAERERRERERRTTEVKAAAQETGRALHASLANLIRRLAELADRLDTCADRSVNAVRIQADHAGNAGRRGEEAGRVLEEIVAAACSMTEAAGAIRVEADRTHGAVLLAAARSDHAAQANQGLLRHVDMVAAAATAIKSVATQTNLLALNAAIEAARGTNDNRGFVQVAKEVKGLAQDTRTSTTTIETRIDAIVAATRASVEAGAAIEQQLTEVRAAAAITAGTALQQEEASANIQARVSDLRETAHGVVSSLGAIARSFGSLSEEAELVRSVSREVREGVQALQLALDQTVETLLST